MAKREHISLRCFNSPREAYHQLPDVEYDAVIVDSNLVIVTGFQLCNYLDRLGKRKPVIMVSAADKMERPDMSFIVKECVPKSYGMAAIFDSARRAARGSVAGRSG